MTRISEQAVIRRIVNPKVAVYDLITEVTNSPEATEAVLEAMDQRVVDSGFLAGSMLLVFYLQKHSRPKLFDGLFEARVLSDNDLAQLFKAGYGDFRAEHRLCDHLYEMFQKDGNPWRVEIVEGLRDRGGAESLAVLEVIRFELDPMLKSKGVVAGSLGQMDEVSYENFLYGATYRALKAFVELVDSALAALRGRVVVPADANTISSTAQSKPNPPASSLTLIGASVGVHHSRLTRVETHLSKARTLVFEHPAESLNNMRKACEAILKDLVDESRTKGKGGGQDQKPAEVYKGLEELLSQVRRKKIVPLHIEKYFETVQSFGNLGSHDQEGEPEDISTEMANSVLIQLDAVVAWFKSFDSKLASDSDGE